MPRRRDRSEIVRGLRSGKQIVDPLAQIAFDPFPTGASNPCLRRLANVGKALADESAQQAWSRCRES
jgi:hypothetical protein